MGCSCCDCCEPLHSCLCPFCRTKHWFIALFTVLAVLAVASVPVLIIRYAVIPHVKVSVADARLDVFELGGGSVLSYNVSVAFAIGNPNRVMRIRYTEPLVATFVFHGRRLSNATVAERGQKHAMGKTRVHTVRAAGQVPASVLGAAAVEDWKKQNATTGVFAVEVRLAGKVTYQEVKAIAKKRTVSVSCLMGLELAPPGPEVVVFQPVSCLPVDKDVIYF